MEFHGMQKFINGEMARLVWAKSIIPESCSVEQLNAACGGVFNLAANIVLDSSKVNTTITVSFPDNTLQKRWKDAGEYIYLIVKDGVIMKIGGTRTSMSERWGSYKCGHCVKERYNKKGEPYPGKMSVTNAHLYHTIEKDLLEKNGAWEFYCWKLPVITLQVDILGMPTTVVAQTYHAYESRCIEKFRELTGHIPQLCDNADPSYRTSRQHNETGGGESVPALIPGTEHDETVFGGGESMPALIPGTEHDETVFGGTGGGESVPAAMSFAGHETGVAYDTYNADMFLLSDM